MAFVRDDDIEGVNRNIQALGVVLGFVVALHVHQPLCPRRSATAMR